jgi:RNA polymerase sigma factor (sigma-70 family)
VDESRRERFEEVAPGLVEPLRRFLARRTDAATAEDVLAETLLVCWRRAADLPDEPLPWAYAVARNCLRNAQRSARRQERVAARLAAEPAHVDPPEDAALADALGRLRPDDAELLRLWAWEQLTPVEIATVLDITANAASIRLHRAREKLKGELRKIDPAAGSLPPAAPHEVARLLEDVMATELTTETRETGTHGRGPLTWLVAAAAVVVIAGAGFFGIRALTGDDDVAPPTAGEPASTTTRLDVPAAGGAAKCAVPSAELLASADVAFDGTVTGIVGDRVTLEPTHWYAGGPTDTVVVTAPSEQMQEVASGVQFRAGGRYLVSASGGQVSLCGFSAPYSDELATIFAKAFPG